MKVTNWRKKLAATLVAGGMISPAAAQAANLDTNLLTNPGFETVDSASTGDYGAPQILNWTGTGYAYSHNPGATGIPDYADGVDPPSAGNWYFTANNQPLADTGDIRDPDAFYQDIAVNAGATATQIASGEAAARFSGWMSSYLNDADFGTIHLQFKDSGGATIGTALVNDSDNGTGNVWSKATGVGYIPLGTTTIRASLYGTSDTEGRGGDGYIDNVDVQVTNAANVLLYAQVNTATGQVAIKNQMGQSVPVDYYEITSASGALNRTTWTSLQDQNLPGLPAGNGSGNGWEEGGGGGNAGISESYLTGSSTVNDGTSIGLGAAFSVGGAHDLVFRYGVVSNLVNSADFDLDGDVDGADFLTWQRGLGKADPITRADGDADDLDPDGDGPLLKSVDANDLAIWKAAWQQRSTLVQGFVRYVTTGVEGVPEPGSLMIAGMGLGVLVLGSRRTAAPKAASD
jgi:hypothetical protein